MRDTVSDLTAREWTDKERAERMLADAERRTENKEARLRFHHYLRTGEHVRDDWKSDELDGVEA
jgi:hypothetical protein